MIVVKLQGGLGNQMFQYAAAKSLARDNEPIYLDNAFFKNTATTVDFTARKYELGIFKNVKTCIADDKLINLFTAKSFYYKLLRWFRTPLYVQQKENEYISFANLPQSKYIYLDGYFQSEKYFAHLHEQLLKDFQFPALDDKNEMIKKQIATSDNSVSIHIRRGDYLKPVFNNIHGILSPQYYYTALNNLENEVAEMSLFIFSDDIQWAKENFTQHNKPVYFIENNTAEDGWKDIALMRTCKHHIIANSSFSWWGAWLSDNNGKVLAPHNWFNAEKVRFNISDFIPANWNVI